MANPAAGDIVTTLSNGPRTRPAVAAAPQLSGAYRFVSSPDFLNQDVGDVRDIGISPLVDSGTGVELNSTSSFYDRALGTVLNEMRGTGADDLLVAGDLVEGRWGQDWHRTGYFGPVRTPAQRVAATKIAAGLYYSTWMRTVRGHGFDPYPAVGDHDIGDNPWTRPGDPWVTFKNRNIGLYKSLFARHTLTKPDGAVRFTDRPSSGQARNTAYASRLDPNVLLITLDVWTRTEGRIGAEVDRAQIRWLRQVLEHAGRAKIPWVIVQGHTPIAGPVRVRYSSGMHYRDGTNSRLWRTMVDGGVDLYLSGEVHDQSAVVRDGILQLSHGSLFYQGEASYVAGQATHDRLVLANQQFSGNRRWEKGRSLWSTSGGTTPIALTYPTPSRTTGVITAKRTSRGGIKVTSASGILKILR